MSVSSPSDLFSHPGRLLRNHLSAVGDAAQTACRSKILDLSEIGITRDDLAEVVRLTGVCHDFGKATTFFQEYLHETDPKRKQQLKSQEESKHGLISAVFAFHCIREKLCGIQGDAAELLPLIGFEAVRRHHGNLGDLVQDAMTTRDAVSIFRRQLESIQIEDAEALYIGLLPQGTVTRFMGSLDEVLSSLKHSYRRIKYLENTGSGYAVVASLCFSLLIAADKEDASQLTVERRPESVPGDLVEKYRSIRGFDRPNNPMDEVRDSLFREVMGQVDRLDLSHRVYSLNAPTGSGKTLAGFGFALRLRDRLQRETGVTPRIIYCISYVSIIDQNYSVFESVFREATGRDPESGQLLKHHHLADLSKWQQEDNEFDAEKSQFLVEGWNSEIIVTTFVQLFQTLLSGRNRATRKYHNLTNSIILLDEVQSLPHRYWLLFRELTLTLSRLFNTYFIYMTATQPLIFEPGEIRELVPDKDRYFKRLDRVELQPKLESVELRDFIEEVISDIEENPGKSFLIVLNTIQSSQMVYEAIMNKGLQNTPLFYLSTMVAPVERLARIRAAMVEKGRRVIVSTQLVEAGVDLDVDVVYRDFATLDSINQVAGRCNRNAASGRGTVKLRKLRDERGRLIHEYIYGKDQVPLTKTQEVLEGRNSILEAEFLETVERYYRLLQGSSSTDDAKKILHCLNELDFKKLREEFSLIEDDQPKIDVFVELDEEAETVWRGYLEVKALQDHTERRRRFSALRRRFYEYVISIPERYSSEIGINGGDELGYIPRVLVDAGNTYRRDIGFNRLKKVGGDTLIL